MLQSNCLQCQFARTTWSRRPERRRVLPAVGLRPSRECDWGGGEDKEKFEV